jgi:hypothetical protein
MMAASSRSIPLAPMRSRRVSEVGTEVIEPQTNCHKGSPASVRAPAYRQNVEVLQIGERDISRFGLPESPSVS